MGFSSDSQNDAYNYLIYFYNENVCNFEIMGWKVSMAFWNCIERLGINMEIEKKLVIL